MTKYATEVAPPVKVPDKDQGEVVDKHLLILAADRDKSTGAMPSGADDGESSDEGGLASSRTMKQKKKQQKQKQKQRQKQRPTKRRRVASDDEASDDE